MRPQTPISTGHNAHVYYLRFESLEAREKVRLGLRSAGIVASFHYIPLHSSQGGSALAVLAIPWTLRFGCQQFAPIPLYADLQSTIRRR